MYSPNRLFRVVTVLVALLLATLACNLKIGDQAPLSASPSVSVQRPTVEIIEPANGTTYTVGQVVTVRARATSPSGVTSVELLANTVRVDSQLPAAEASPALVEVVMDYTPDRPGTVTLVVQAYSGSVVSPPAQRTITVLPQLQPGTGGAATTPQAFIAPTSTPFNPICRARVNAGGLRFRTGPGTNYDIISNFNAGDEPLIVGYSDRPDGRWWQVSWGGQFGWTSATYTTQLGDCSTIQPVVVPPSPTPVPSETPQPTQPGTTATPTMPDLVLSLLEGVSEVQLGVNGTAQANFAVQVRNNGGQQAGAFRVAVLKPDGQIDYVNVPGLSPGQTADIPAPGGLVVTFQTPGVARILVTVDDQNTVAESNEGNNQAYRDVIVNPGPATNTPPPTQAPPPTQPPALTDTPEGGGALSPIQEVPTLPDAVVVPPVATVQPPAQVSAPLAPIDPFNAPQIEEIAAMTGHGGAITGLDFNPAGTMLVSSSRDGTLRLWDVYLETELLTLTGHTDQISDVAFSPDGTRIASASWDGTVRLWNATDGTPLFTLTHGARVNRVTFSADGSRIASGGENLEPTGGLAGLARVWDANTGAEITAVRTFGEVTGIGFITNETLVVGTAAQDCNLGGGEVAFYDLNDPNVATFTLAEDTSIEVMVASAATGLVAAGGQEELCSGPYLVQVWHTSGAVQATLDHGNTPVTDIAFNATGTLVVTTTGDGTVRVWDLSTSGQLAVLSAAGTTAGVAFSPDGTRIASGGAADAVLLWAID